MIFLTFAFVLNKKTSKGNSHDSILSDAVFQKIKVTFWKSNLEIILKKKTE